MADTTQIKSYWNKKADKDKTAPQATSHDAIFRGNEYKKIIKYIRRYAPSPHHILDLGCGNGYATIEFARSFPSATVIGADYSEPMIREAHNQEKLPNLSFEVGDALKLRFKDESFDVVTTTRCLINIPTWEGQIDALKEIERVLAPGGTYVMLEATMEGFEGTNTWRRRVGLPAMKPHPVNLYFEEKKLLSHMKKHFLLKKVDTFSSTFYFGSRVVYPFFLKLVAPKKEPRHDALFNRMLTKLPNIGKSGRLKIFVFKKVKS